MEHSPLSLFEHLRRRSDPERLASAPEVGSG